MKAYWFSRLDGTTKYQTTPAEIGRTDTCEGEIIPCKNGLHGSPTPYDALCYAEGTMLWVVELDGEIVEHGDPVDKYAARKRAYLQKLDCTKICRIFAAQKALKVIDRWDAPDIVKEYLTDTAQGKDREDIREAAFYYAVEATRAYFAAVEATRVFYYAIEATRAARAARAASFAAEAEAEPFATRAAEFNDKIYAELKKIKKGLDI